MNNTKNIRWAILGAGNIAKSFVKDFALMQHASLVAVASGNEERAKQFAGLHHIPQVLTYEELYSSTAIDAVYISTTHNFHFEHALKCIQNGKAVLCEKPITVNDKEFKILAAVSKANNIFLMEAMWTYFMPAVQKAKQWVDEGRIGKIKVIQADFAMAAPKNLTGRLYNPALAGGSLLDIGIYPIAFAYYFANSAPQKIVASARMAATGVDESVGMLFEYADITASLFCSVTTKMKNTGYLFGEEGYIELPHFHKAREVHLYDKNFELTETYNDGRSSHGFIYEMQHANDSISAGYFESPVIPHSRSNDMQETMTDIRKQIGLKYPFE